MVRHRRIGSSPPGIKLLSFNFLMSTLTPPKVKVGSTMVLRARPAVSVYLFAAQITRAADLDRTPWEFISAVC